MYGVRHDPVILAINEISELYEVCNGIPYEVYLDIPLELLSAYYLFKNSLRQYRAEYEKEKIQSQSNARAMTWRGQR